MVGKPVRAILDKKYEAEKESKERHEREWVIDFFGKDE